MKKQVKIFPLLMIMVLFLSGSPGCKKEQNNKPVSLQKLHELYLDGEINECKFNGQTVYCAGLNRYDAGSAVYDQEANQIGSCNYAYGYVDSICSKLTDCEVVYRVKDNIWGLPAVDKYGLGQ